MNLTIAILLIGIVGTASTGVVVALLTAYLRRPIDRAQTRAAETQADFNTTQIVKSNIETIHEIVLDLRAKNIEYSQLIATQTLQITVLQGKVVELQNLITVATTENVALRNEVAELKQKVADLTLKTADQAAEIQKLLLKLAEPADGGATRESANESAKGNPTNEGSSVEAAKADPATASAPATTGAG